MSLRDSPVYFIILAYIACSWLLALAYGVIGQFSLLVYSRPVMTTTFLIISLFMGWLCFYTMIKIRPKHITVFLINDLKTRWLTKQRLSQAISLLLFFMLFLSAFSSMKSMIPVVQPYRWDAAFFTLDKVIHFGRDPWTLLQPFLGFPFVSFLVNVVYNLWFPVIFAVLYWQIFTLKRRNLRQQFLLTFFLCWIINGTVLAILFSSAGPCFFGHILPDTTNPYAPLMAYLQQTNEIFPLWALETQNMLWRLYEDSASGFGSGISAMPSVHVSVAWLLFLFGWKTGTVWRWIFGIFFAFIMIGSVHLGWHYAVDGYLAILTTSAIWFLSGKYKFLNDVRNGQALILLSNQMNSSYREGKEP